MDESIPVSRHLDSLGHAVLWALLSTLALLLIAPAVGDAQVVTTSITSTTGAGNLGTTITQAGNLYDITGGTRPGNGPNLFHSFGDFSVGGGDIGNFLNDTGLPTSNILSRVTGGDISNIYGTIQTTDFGSANLFLVNPSGIVLGPHGSVNVGGSVSFTTAQYLRLFDGVNSANFYANPANDGLATSVLAVAPLVDFGFLSPAAYGFLTPPDPSATITVQGSALSVPFGQSISLVGGKVVIQAATLLDGTVQPTHLSAPNGTIQLASAASPGEFVVGTLQPVPNVDGASFTSFGSAVLGPGSSIDVSGPSTVFVKGGQLVLSVNDATLSTTESSVPSDTVSLSPGSSIVTWNSETEPGADLQITVGNLQMDGDASITANTTGAGDAGDIAIKADKVTLDGEPDSNPRIASDTIGAGSAGSIDLSLTNLTLNDGSISSSNLHLLGTGNAGSIDIHGFGGKGTSASVVTLGSSDEALNRASIEATMLGQGSGGSISISADELTVNRAGIINANTWSSAATSIGGVVTINANTVNVYGGFISSQTTGAVSAGPISLNASQLNLFEAASIFGNSNGGPGNGGTITIKADNVTLKTSFKSPGFSPNTSIASTTHGSGNGDSPGNAGSIDLFVKNLTMEGSVGIVTSTFEFGNGGTITIKADNVTLNSSSHDGRAFIQSGTFGSGNAGSIELSVGNLTLNPLSTISSSSGVGAGQAGNVDVHGVGGKGTAANVITLNNGAIFASTEGQGRGGNINVAASHMTMANGAKVSAASSGTGDAGNITINAGSDFLSTNSSVTTEASQASGGNITLLASDMINLRNSQISTSVLGGTQTAGGNITIDPQFVILQNSQITANAAAGSGGAINVTAGVFLADPNSVVDASSQQGPQGTVSIQSPVQNVGGLSTPLTQEFSSAAALLTQRCAADPTGQFSSFVQTGRDGVPQVPGALSPSPLSFLETLTSGSLGTESPNWAAARLGLDSVRVDGSTWFHSACRS